MWWWPRKCRRMWKSNRPKPKIVLLLDCKIKWERERARFSTQHNHDSSRWRQGIESVPCAFDTNKKASVQCVALSLNWLAGFASHCLARLFRLALLHGHFYMWWRPTNIHITYITYICMCYTSKWPRATSLTKPDCTFHYIIWIEIVQCTKHKHFLYLYLLFAAISGSPHGECKAAA